MEEQTLPTSTDGESEVFSIEETLRVRNLTRIKSTRKLLYATNPHEETQPASHFEFRCDIFSLTVANAAPAGDEFNIQLITVNAEQIKFYLSICRKPQKFQLL